MSGGGPEDQVGKPMDPGAAGRCAKRWVSRYTLFIVMLNSFPKGTVVGCGPKQFISTAGQPAYMSHLGAPAALGKVTMFTKP